MTVLALRLRSLLRPLSALTATTALLFAAGCPGGVGTGGTGGSAAGSGGATTTGTGGGTTTGSGGATTPGSGGATTPGSGGATTPGTGGGTTPGTGGRTTGSGGRMAGTGGMTTTPGSGGGAGTTVAQPLDCGPLGWAVENHGPPSNRVNYAILGDGYQTADYAAGGAFEQHINAAMAKRFTPVIGQVYGRYRNFINICAIKIVSTGAICGSSALGCCGDDSSRLANCNSTMVNAGFSQNVPASFMMDWRAVVLNGSSWWNTGAATMLWSGGNKDGPGAALHEGGHGFHSFADEYCSAGTGAGCGTVNGGTDATGTDNGQVNLTNKGMTAGTKWPMWMAYDQAGATGVQGTYSMGSGPYRPSVNSMMNSLFGTNVNTSFNSVSREKMVMDIWQRCVPVDSTEPPAGAVSGAMTLKVNVIDPAVIDVDWSVDGNVVAAKGGPTFDVAARGLSSGSHMISAKAYDNAGMDLVRQVPQTVFGRQNWARSVQTVNWTVTIP